MKTPRDYDIPHDEWRPNQLELIERVETSTNSFIIVEAPTGFGKSLISAALGYEEKVLVLVHTLALLDQYENLYDFKVVRGRQEYPCVLPEKVEAWKEIYDLKPSVADCTYNSMWECPSSESCPYLIAKKEAQNARRTACTYRYAALSSMMAERTGHIVLDEAHDSAEEMIRFNAFDIKNHMLKKYNLPLFSLTEFGEDNKGALLNEDSTQIVMEWLNDLIMKVQEDRPNTDSPEDARADRLYKRLNKVSEQLSQNKWFLKITEEGPTLQALSAKRIAAKIFAHKNIKLLMSATIGDPKPLTDILGIEAYQHLTFDHPVPIKNRPIKLLNVERMTARNLKVDGNLYHTQAEKIAEWIENFPEEWRGVIVTTSYYKIQQLHMHIEPFLSGRRLIVQERGQKVGKVVEKFITDTRPGDIMIGTIQGMGTGLDLSHDLARFIAIAGVPHVNPMDRYMQVRRDEEGGKTYQLWKTFNAIIQAAGRVSRGEISDGEFETNYVAIADGSALTKTAMTYYSKWFMDAMV